MKKVVLFLLLIVAFVACTDKEPIFRLDPMAKVYVKPSPDAQKAYFVAKSTCIRLSPLEVVKQARNLMGYNRLIGESNILWTWVGKDTISAIPALLRWGTDIIHDKDGFGNYGLQTEFIYAFDLIITSGKYPKFDTIAYIPNANMAAAREQIKKAFSERDTEAVYRIFRDAFKFTPITGAEYRELKRRNLQ